MKQKMISKMRQPVSITEELEQFNRMEREGIECVLVANVTTRYNFTSGLGHDIVQNPVPRLVDIDVVTKYDWQTLKQQKDFDFRHCPNPSDMQVVGNYDLPPSQAVLDIMKSKEGTWGIHNWHAIANLMDYSEYLEKVQENIHYFATYFGIRTVNSEVVCTSNSIFNTPMHGPMHPKYNHLIPTSGLTNIPQAIVNENSNVYTKGLWICSTNLNSLNTTYSSYLTPVQIALISSLSSTKNMPTFFRIIRRFIVSYQENKPELQGQD